MKKMLVLIVASLCAAMPIVAAADSAGSSRVAVRVARAKKKKAKKPTVNANLKKVCPKTMELPRNMIYKSIASHHITDARARSTSFIGTTSAPSVPFSKLSVYDKKGKLVHSMGLYQVGAGWRWRFYGGYTPRGGDSKTAVQVANDAKRNTGSPEIYIKISSNQCVRVPDANRCYNSAGC